MIGGIVIETIVLSDKVWINCREKQSTHECAIYVKRNAKAECVSEGDTIWWQSSSVYWTPACHKPVGKCGKDYDIKLERASYSGVSRPNKSEACK